MESICRCKFSRMGDHMGLELALLDVGVMFRRCLNSRTHATTGYTDRIHWVFLTRRYKVPSTYPLLLRLPIQRHYASEAYPPHTLQHHYTQSHRDNSRPCPDSTPLIPSPRTDRRRRRRCRLRTPRLSSPNPRHYIARHIPTRVRRPRYPREIVRDLSYLRQGRRDGLADRGYHIADEGGWC